MTRAGALAGDTTSGRGSGAATIRKPRARTAGSGTKEKRSAPNANASGFAGYLARSELPLTGLAFLLPLIIAYEVGTYYFTFDPIRRTEQRIIAFNMMQKFFLFFGASGRHMPGLAVVGILLTWHIARRDRWSVRLSDVVGIAIESFVLAIPLLVVGRLAENYLPRVPLMIASSDTRGLLVLSIGAGVYEELVFRLIGFSVVSLVVMDALRFGRFTGTLLVVLCTSVLFSGYHYLGSEPFQWWTFTFRAAAGAYFGAVFLTRGFGITAGSHAAYDVMIVLLRGVA